MKSLRLCLVSHNHFPVGARVCVFGYLCRQRDDGSMASGGVGELCKHA